MGAMASASPSHRSNNKDPNNSLSYFRKTVCLEDWWLVKAEKDIEGRRLAVAGFTSREQQALRIFSSAPIRRTYDVFKLETTDGIFVIIKGLINKARTEENGFPYEVFKHFVFGFPPYWEEYAEKCLGGGVATDIVSRGNPVVDELFTNSGEVASLRVSSIRTPENYEKDISEVTHVDSDKMNMGVEDCEDMVLENGQHCCSPTESPIEVSKEPKVDIDSGVPIGDLRGTVERYNSTSKNGGHPILGVGPVINDVDKMKNVAIENRSSSVNSHMDAINSPNIAVQLEDSSCYVKRSRMRKESKKNKRKKSRTRGNSENKGLDSKEDHNNSDIMIQAGTQTNTNEVVRNDIRLGPAGDKNCLKIAVGEKVGVSKEARATRKKAKRKLTYESPVTRSGKERASIVSPESLSSKRSRSGRLLLPTLEFWRNQTAIYDADRRITGINEGLLVVQPYRDSKSEAQRNAEPQRKGK